MVQAGRCLSPDLSSGPDLGSGPAPRQAPPSVWSLLGIVSLPSVFRPSPPTPLVLRLSLGGEKKTFRYNTMFSDIHSAISVFLFHT